MYKNKNEVAKFELRFIELMASWCLLLIKMPHCEGAKAGHYRIETGCI